nr:sulfatase-like hydrolase/transferase [Octadecabacter sp.]
PYDPTAEALALYDGKAFPEPIRGYDLDTQPTALRKLRENHIENDHDAVVHLENPTLEQTQRQRAHYFANITMIDEQLGALRDALEKRGVADNTIIIFTSDHGDSLNDHGHSQKWNMFEPSVRVPAVVYDPRASNRGKRVDDLTALFDFGPTILDVAGVETPEWMEATSLTPYLTDGPTPPRGPVFAELADDMVQEYCQFMTMIREDDWKLVYFLNSDEGQLFDLSRDPDEINNLWDDTNHSAKRNDLTRKILDWRLQSSRQTQSFVARGAS